MTLESDRGPWVVAIENKPERASPEHYDQVRGYERVLRRKYGGRDIRSVLLSTSRKGIDGEDKIAHVSWRDVGAQIETMHRAGDFEEEEVAAFIRQYLVAVGRMIGPEESDAHYFRKLLDDHHSLLKRIFDMLRDEDGADKIRAMVPDCHADYRGTVVRLAKDFGQEPERLRDEVREMLTSRGMTTTVSANPPKTAFWLSWDMKEAAALGIGGYLKWKLSFRHHRVSVRFQNPPLSRTDSKAAKVKRIKIFIRKTPIDPRRSRQNRHVMEGGHYNSYFYFYRHQLVDDDVLSGRSTAEVTEAMLQAVANFLDSEDSDYRRINDYFRCLAFRFDAAAAAQEEAGISP